MDRILDDIGVEREQPKEKPKQVVWVIDDDIHIAEGLEMYLGMEGFDVKIFTSGESALETLAREESPSVFIIDGNLGSSRMKGWDIVSGIGEKGKDSLIITHSSTRGDNELMAENAKKLGIKAKIFEKGSREYDLSKLVDVIKSSGS
ncbi:MAG: response regulator [Candidatus Paceibacterota bacterium]|jgi:DNA-binding NtrC family response regulator